MCCSSAVTVPQLSPDFYNSVPIACGLTSFQYVPTYNILLAPGVFNISPKGHLVLSDNSYASAPDLWTSPLLSFPTGAYSSIRSEYSEGIWISGSDGNICFSYFTASSRSYVAVWCSSTSKMSPYYPNTLLVGDGRLYVQDQQGRVLGQWPDAQRPPSPPLWFGEWHQSRSVQIRNFFFFSF